ncbi:TetR/AcrR family transcriptional regulator [Specibacter sp. RAF43]|uniref:TetR/AcrR family transcriptional regulator n=1 Tax=Specibacter sp. RAF43 TaxID=3233057 RepID=UPI003F955D7F
MSLFSEKGFHETSVEEIAELADVARATAFNYFPKKSDFIQEWGSRRRVLVEAIIDGEKLEAHGLLVLLTRYVHELASSHSEHRDLTRRIFDAWVQSGGPMRDDPYLADLLGSHVRKAQERGEVRSNIDPDVVGHLCRDAYFGVLFHWLRGPVEPFDLEQRLQASIEVILIGVLSS